MYIVCSLFELMKKSLMIIVNVLTFEENEQIRINFGGSVLSYVAGLFIGRRAEYITEISTVNEF